MSHRAHRAHRAQFQLVAPFLCFSLLAACGSSGGKSSSDGGAGKGGAGTAGAGGSSTAGAGGSSTAGVGGGTAGLSGSTAGTVGTAGASGSDASAGADGSAVDGSAGADGSHADGSAGASAAAGADGSTSVDATSDVAVSDAGTCPTVANIATTFADTASTGAVPVGTGGAIADGTYTMTGNIIYGASAPSGKTHTYTFKIAGTVMAVTGRDSEDNGDGAGAFTLTANASTGALSVIGFCPAGNVGKNLGNLDSYTATATTIHAYASSKNNEVILTKQ